MYFAMMGSYAPTFLPVVVNSIRYVSSWTFNTSVVNVYVSSFIVIWSERFLYNYKQINRFSVLSVQQIALNLLVQFVNSFNLFSNGKLVFAFSIVLKWEIDHFSYITIGKTQLLVIN